MQNQKKLNLVLVFFLFIIIVFGVYKWMASRPNPAELALGYVKHQQGVLLTRKVYASNDLLELIKPLKLRVDQGFPLVNYMKEYDVSGRHVVHVVIQTVYGPANLFFLAKEYSNLFKEYRSSEPALKQFALARRKAGGYYVIVATTEEALAQVDQIVNPQILEKE